MKIKVIAPILLGVIALIAVGLIIGSQGKKRDEYDFAFEIAKNEGGFVRFGPRDDPQTQISGDNRTFMVNSWIEIERSVMGQRLSGTTGVVRRTCTIMGTLPDESPRGWFDKIYAGLFPARSMGSPGHVVYDNPDLAEILKSVRERRGKENPANLIQDIGWALGYVAYEEKPIKFDLLLLRAQIEHEAGRDDLARQSLKAMAHKVKTPESPWYEEWMELDATLKP